MDFRKKNNGYEKNPFTKELRGRMFIQPRANMVIAKDEKLVNTETGEIMKDATLLGRQKIVDKSEFVKIYASNIGDMMELTPRGKRAFIYICKNLTYNNEVWMPVKNLGYKHTKSATDGIKELLNKNMIAISQKPEHYWVNPLYICKGERFAKYTTYITEETRGNYGDAIKSVMGNENANKQLPLFNSENEKLDPYANDKDKNDTEILK